jgi:hypothetical protein
VWDADVVALIAAQMVVIASAQRRGMFQVLRMGDRE